MLRLVEEVEAREEVEGREGKFEASEGGRREEVAMAVSLVADAEGPTELAAIDGRDETATCLRERAEGALETRETAGDLVEGEIDVCEAACRGRAGTAKSEGATNAAGGGLLMSGDAADDEEVGGRVE